MDCRKKKKQKTWKSIGKVFYLLFLSHSAFTLDSLYVSRHPVFGFLMGLLCQFFFFFFLTRLGLCSRLTSLFATSRHSKYKKRAKNNTVSQSTPSLLCQFFRALPTTLFPWLDRYIVLNSPKTLLLSQITLSKLLGFFVSIINPLVSDIFSADRARIPFHLL